MDESLDERAARHKRLLFLCNSKDDEAVRCRLFVCGKGIDFVDKSELINLFAPFGRVYDLALHKGFVFVQYDNLDSANAAIQKLDETPYQGGLLTVRLAEKGKKAEAAESEVCKFFLQGHCMRGESCNFLHVNSEGQEMVAYPPVGNALLPAPVAHERDFRKRGPPDRFYDREFERPFKRHLDDFDRIPSPAAYPGYPPYDRFGHSLPPEREPPTDVRPPYDCVIITASDALRGYCQMIERRIKEFGMLTTVQMVDGEHFMKRAVEDAAKHTVPYTISVTANNEEHRSLTLNILYGVAQEHRNMPIEDAIPFLSRNFDQFVEMMKKKLAVVKQWIPPDSKTTYLLNLLADGRRLTVAELEEVSQYITTLLNRTKGPEPEEPQGVGRADNGWQTHQPNNDYDPRIPERLLSSERPSNVLPPARSEPLLPPPTLQKGDYSGGLQGVNKNKEVEHKGVGGLYQQRYMESSNPTAGSSSASGINFDNPAVKRALEDLLRSSKSSAPPANRGLLF